MSLKNNPFKNKKLSELNIYDSIPSNIDDNSTRRDHASIYLASMICLGHGRRDLLVMTFLWQRSVAVARACSPTDYQQTLEGVRGWSIIFFQYLIDSLLEHRGEVGEEDFKLSGGGRLCSIIQSALTHVEAMKGELSQNFLQESFDASTENEGDKGDLDLISRCAFFSSMACSMSDSAVLSDNAEARKGILRAMTSNINQAFDGNFDHVPRLTYNAFEIMNSKNHVSNITQVWETLSDHFCHASSCSDIPESPDYASAIDRMKQRCSKSPKVQASSDTYDQVTERTYTDALALFITKTLEAKSFDPRPVMGGLTSYLMIESANMVPITFFSKKAYESFRLEGKTKTVWERSQEEDFKESWHYRYTDVPMHGRALCDKRLFGEKGTDITYAVFIHKGMLNQIKTLADMYGEVAVTWKRDCLDYSSLTINDSMHAPFVTPATIETLKKFVASYYLPSFINSVKADPKVRDFVTTMTGYPCHPNFVELQIHKSMTVDDIESVEKVN